MTKAEKKQKAFDRTFLDMAVSLSKLSKCVSHQVACLLVKDNRVISSGINGTANGYVNCDQLFKKDDPSTKREHDEFSDAYEIHAEMNAILVAAKNGIAIDGSTAYCILQPCFPCLKNLSMTGVKRVVYLKAKGHRSDKNNKRDTYAKKVGIKLEQYRD